MGTSVVEDELAHGVLDQLLANGMQRFLGAASTKALDNSVGTPASVVLDCVDESPAAGVIRASNGVSGEPQEIGASGVHAPATEGASGGESLPPSRQEEEAVHPRHILEAPAKC